MYRPVLPGWNFLDRCRVERYLANFRFYCEDESESLLQRVKKTSTLSLQLIPHKTVLTFQLFVVILIDQSPKQQHPLSLQQNLSHKNVWKTGEMKLLSFCKLCGATFCFYYALSLL